MVGGHAQSGKLQILGQKCAVGEIGQHIMNCRMPKVILALLQLSTDPLLFRNMTVQFRRAEQAIIAELKATTRASY